MKDKYALRRTKNRMLNILWTIVGVVVVLWVGGRFLGGCDSWWHTLKETITEEN